MVDLRCMLGYDELSGGPHHVESRSVAGGDPGGLRCDLEFGLRCPR